MAQRSSRNSARAPRLPLERLGIATAVLAVIGAAATILKDKEVSDALHLPTWLVVTVIIVLGLLPLAIGVVGFIQQRREKQSAWVAAARAALRRGPPLPRFGGSEAVDPYKELGVFRSAIADRYRTDGEPPPYVPRDVERDGALDIALKTAPLTIFVGPSKAGKSRTAYEACQRVFPGHQVLVPSGPKALADLFELDPPIPLDPTPAVLWLDDLERYTNAGLLTAAMVDAWERGEPGIVGVATMRDTEYGRVRETPGDVARAAREVLDHPRAHVVWLSGEPSPDEVADAQRHYPGEDFSGGIGEHFAAGEALVDKLRTGVSEHPAGVALVLAAVDWRRCGLSRPIPESNLKDLFPAYLRDLRRDLDPSDELYASALEWARQPVSSSAALLTVSGNGAERSVRVFDYILGYVDTRGHEINPRLQAVREETWAYVLDVSSLDDAYAVGLASYTRGLRHVAMVANTKASAALADTGASATYALGVLLEEQGNLEGAKKLWQLASERGNASAANNLGVLLADQGDSEGAKEQYRLAIERGSASAAYNLANLLHRQGDLDGAKEQWQLAIKRGYPRAAYNLGLVLHEQGDLDGAKKQWQLASEWGDATAAYNLGIVLAGLGDTEGAKEQYRLASERGHADAATNLRILLAQQGGLEGRGSGLG